MPGLKPGASSISFKASSGARSKVGLQPTAGEGDIGHGPLVEPLFTREGNREAGPVEHLLAAVASLFDLDIVAPLEGPEAMGAGLAAERINEQ